jgi:hypothetical protein
VSLKPSGNVTPLKFMRLVPLAAPKCAKTRVISSDTKTANSQCLILERLAMRPPRAHENVTLAVSFGWERYTASRRKRLSRRCHVWLHR